MDALKTNLGGSAAATVEATLAFIRAFIDSMPTGKQNTFAARTLPEAVIVTVREDRPISYINAFEKPVTEKSSEGRRLAAAHALATEAANIREAYGYEPKVSYVVALGELREALSNMGETVTLKELLASLESQLTELVGQES